MLTPPAYLVLSLKEALAPLPLRGTITDPPGYMVMLVVNVSLDVTNFGSKVCKLVEEHQIQLSNYCRSLGPQVPHVCGHALFTCLEMPFQTADVD